MEADRRDPRPLTPEKRVRLVISNMEMSGFSISPELAAELRAKLTDPEYLRAQKERIEQAEKRFGLKP
jgi:hypothetical protein